MKKIILLLFLSSLSLLATQKVVLQLSWLHQFQFAGYYVAKELGYYEDVGIDVEIKEYDAHTDLSTVLQKKEADFAVGRSSILIDKMNGKDIVALGAIFQESPLMLLVTNDSNISSIADLKNKRIMLTPDAKSTASIMAMLFSNGITQKDIEILPHSFELDDLINKKTDAMASYVSNEPLQLSERHIGYKIFHPNEYGFHFYGDILFSSSEFIQNNPKLTQNFYEATIKGWKYAFENISQTAEIIHNHYNTQNRTLLQLIKEGEVLRKLAQNEKGILGYLSKNQLKEIINVYKVLGIVTKDIDLDAFIYEHNHPTELAFTLSHDDIFHIFLISILSLVMFGFSVLFISLRKQWLHTKSNLKKKIENQKDEIEKQNMLIIEQSKITAIGEMLNNIAHQWRQPLNIISLNTVKMETSILLGQEMNKEEYLKISDEINRQSQYLSETIDDFRNYFNSNIENIAEFNLKDAIKKVAELTKDTFKSNSIENIVSVNDCTIVNNESLFIQALLNICNNAKDAIEQSNAAKRYFFIEAQCEENSIIIKLRDSGGGVEESVISKIFEPYFTTKHKTKGTGLGLYISYEIITKHLKGTLFVHNVEYEYMKNKLSGAEFVIKVPLI